jgi:dolichyl-phosphate beta-glucosyltransferase
MKTPTVSIIVPVYNEEKRIRSTLQTVNAYFEKRYSSFEIIAVDDSSTDESLTALRDLQLRHPRLTVIALPKNSWKGWAVRTGVLAARGDLILITDADLSTPIGQFSRLTKQLYRSKAAIAIGSRVHGTHDERASQPLIRRLFGKLFTYLRKSLIADLEDTQCGFKLYRREVAYDLFVRQRIQNIIFDVEILYLAHKRGYKVIEVPVQWQHRPSDRMRASMRNAIQTMLALLVIWRVHHKIQPPASGAHIRRRTAKI